MALKAKLKNSHFEGNWCCNILTKGRTIIAEKMSSNVPFKAIIGIICFKVKFPNTTAKPKTPIVLTNVAPRLDAKIAIFPFFKPIQT